MGDSVGSLEAAQRRCNPAAEPWSLPGGCRGIDLQKRLILLEARVDISIGL